MKKILFIFGTRPEVIKLAPVIKAFASDKNIRSVLCNTGQQRELTEQTLSYFNLKADFSLDVMETNQTLTSVEAKMLIKLQKIIDDHHYDAVIAQGDTMTVFCAAQVAFYNKIPFFHIEAGLRSYDLGHPFPEEMIRQCVSRIADLHFAPTQRSQEALLKENIPQQKIHVTGNTIVDTLQMLSTDEKFWDKRIPKNKELVLITVHRRENHGEKLNPIMEAIKILAQKYTNTYFVIPVHPNPNVKSNIHQTLKDIPNILLLEPLDYLTLVQIMKKAKLILTDSGGIQEEAPTFGCPVLVLRKTTERMEGVTAGFSKLLGTDTHLIVKEASAILDKSFQETRLNHRQNPYGDGQASQRIYDIIKKYLI